MAKEKKQKFKPSSESEVASALKWMAENKNQIPTSILNMLENYTTIIDELKNSQSKRNTLLVELRRALGIESSSERKKQRSEKTQEDKRESLLKGKNYHENRIDWHKNQMKKHTVMAKDIDKKIKSIDDIVLSEEDLNATKEEVKKETEILESGGDADPSLLTPKEALMSGLDSQLVQEEVDILLPQSDSEEYKNTFFETRTRYDFDFQIAEIKIHVEKGQDSSSRMVSGSTHFIGPPNFQVTWGFLANMTLLTTQYAIPFERMARLLSTQQKKFSSNHMCRYFSYVAGRLLPIYLHLAKQLSKSDFISGDDTVVRVVESQKAFEEKTKPWEHYGTMESAEETLNKNPDLAELGPKIAAELGFEFQRKNGAGAKKQLHTTVMIGKETPDPESYIVFYRTHLGSFGNLLDTILLQRPQQKNKLFLQSDLSTTNLISDPLLLEKLDLTLFGCAAHARRPFALYEDSDPLCAFILCIFRNIYYVETRLNVWGRNQTNVTALRKETAKKHWEDILDCCHKLCHRWSSSTPVGEGARYIIRHYTKLTAYLDHPFAPLTNDLSERMLRMEKLIQVNSLFRNSLEGRFALDICRTIVQTALAAGVDVKQYLLYVLKQKNLHETPQLFTPFQFSKNKNDQ